MTESAWKLYLVRFTNVIFWPVALLLGMRYFCPEMDILHMLAIAVLATWLVDEVGSFACLYRGKPLSRKVERCFFPLYLATTAIAWWGMQSGWPASKTTHEKWLIGSGFLAALGLAWVLEDMLATHARPHRKIDWSQAFCFQKPKAKPKPKSVIPEEVDLGVEATPVEDFDRPRPEPEEFANSEPVDEPVKPPGVEEPPEMKVVKVLEPMAQNSETVVERQFCDFAEAVRLSRAEALGVEMPQNDGAPDLVRGSPEDSRVEAIAEEISAKLTSPAFEPEAAVASAVQAGVQEAVSEAVETGSERNPDLIAGLDLKIATVRGKLRRTRTKLAICFGVLLGTVGARLGIGVLAPLAQISVALEVLVLVILLAGAFVMGSLALSLSDKESEQCKWLGVTTAVVLVTGVPLYIILRQGWLTMIEIAALSRLIHPVDVLIVLGCLGYIYYLRRGVKYLKQENDAALQLVNAMSVPGATAAELNQAATLKQETQTRFGSLSLRWIWGLKSYDGSLPVSEGRAA